MCHTYLCLMCVEGCCATAELAATRLEEAWPALHLLGSTIDGMPRLPWVSQAEALTRAACCLPELDTMSIVFTASSTRAPVCDTGGATVSLLELATTIDRIVLASDHTQALRVRLDAYGVSIYCGL